MKKLVVALDFDGVVSANISHYVQLSWDLKRSGHEVHLVTACNPARLRQVRSIVENYGLQLHCLHTRPNDFVSSVKNIGEWKKQVLKDINADIWFDNEIKNYELEGINFNDLNVAIIRV